MSLTGVPRSTRGVIDRPRVSALLESPAQLVVLHAPSGYGKSVALARWAATTPRRGVWIRLREHVETAAAFVQQVAAEIVASGIVASDGALSRATEVLMLMRDPWDFLAAGLREVEGPLTLALDEAHVLDDETVEGIVALLVDSPQLSVRVATRRANRFVDPGIGLRIDVDVVDTPRMALTPDEAAAVLGERATSTTVDAVMAAGGAPALARLIVLGAERGGTGADSWSVADAADSLLRMRQASWEPAFLAFLQRCALTEIIDTTFARQLTGAPDAQELLDRAELEGLGWWTTPRGNEKSPQFVFASFFREALERSLRRELTKGELRRLVLLVAVHEFERDRPFPALRRAVECGDWDLATAVVRAHWNELLQYAAQVRTLFRSVPAVTLRRLPIIAMLLAIIYNARATQRLRAVEYFLLAAYGARVMRARVSPADRALLSGIETAATRVAGRSRAAAASARAGYDALLSMSLDDRESLGRNEPVLWTQLGTSFFYTGDTQRALDCFQRATAVADAKGLLAGLPGLALTAGTLAVNGEITAAARVAREARSRRWPDGWIEGYPGSFYQLAEIFIALEGGRVDDAEAHLRLIAPHRWTIEHWALFAHVEALIDLHRHDAAHAALRLEATLRGQRARQASLALTESRMRHTIALVELARGDAAAAERALAKEAPGIRTAVSSARIALAQGAGERALRTLQSHEGDAGSPRAQAEHLALTAAALALTGDRGEGGLPAVLERLTALLHEHGQALALALVPTDALDALIEARRSRRLAPSLEDMLVRARAIALIPSLDAAPRLTPREIAVARQLPHHDSVKEIAAALNVSPNTVKTQLRSLYRKLGVSNRTDALQALITHPPAEPVPSAETPA